MERVAAKITDGAQCPALIAGHHALGGIFHHLQVMAARNLHDGIHIAGHTGIVHHADNFGFFGNGGFNFCFVNVHGVRADIHKHQLGPS